MAPPQIYSGWSCRLREVGGRSRVLEVPLGHQDPGRKSWQSSPLLHSASPSKGLSSSEYLSFPLCQQRSFFYPVQPLSSLPPSSLFPRSLSISHQLFLISPLLPLLEAGGEGQRKGRLQVQACGVIPSSYPASSQRGKSTYISAPPPTKMPLLLTPK